MEEIQFNHTLPIQLRFNDVDKFGHVNNTVYFSFYDLGKTEYFASVCPDVDWEKDGIVVVHIEANFLAQIYGSDHIAVQTAVTEIGTKSFHLAQRVIDTETQEIKCICTSVMVYNDSQTAKTGNIVALEKAEKKKTINRPFSPRSPKYRTQVYAPPAAIPPKKPQTLANKFALAKVGLIMQSAPKNATTIAIACLGRTFSLIKTAEKSSAKKGLILLSIDASLRSSRSMA